MNVSYAARAAAVRGITAPMTHNSGKKITKRNITQWPFLNVIHPSVKCAWEDSNPRPSD